jgi:xanthine dehydrogenase accessory factor
MTFDDLSRWWSAGKPAEIGHRRGHLAPRTRPAGAVMFVGPGGSAAGSTSGAALEPAAFDLTTHVITSGVPLLQRYGRRDEDAFPGGLTCRGVIDAFKRVRGDARWR